MISFDINKFRVEHIKIKRVSGMQGGTVTFLDEKRSTPEKEVFTKRRIPVNVARMFKKEYVLTQYIKPVLGALLYYDNHVVALERHVLGNLGTEDQEGLDGKTKWRSRCEENVETYLPETTTGDWYIDGSYIYQFTLGLDLAMQHSTPLNDNGKFRQINAITIKLADLAHKLNPQYDTRVCLGYFPNDKDGMISPPIWKTLDKIGSKHITHDDEENEDVTNLIVDLHQFDKIDEAMCVNLSFVLKAGRELTNAFGYDSIQPLNLPSLMLRLRTVNLPNVVTSVKTTYDTGLPFTHAAAWLLGLLHRVNTLESFIVVRSLLKYLTSRGMYRRDAFNKQQIFTNGQTFDTVPLKTIEQAAME